jgi:hypothetical protein
VWFAWLRVCSRGAILHLACAHLLSTSLHLVFVLSVCKRAPWFAPMLSVCCCVSPWSPRYTARLVAACAGLTSEDPAQWTRVDGMSLAGCDDPLIQQLKGLSRTDCMCVRGCWRFLWLLCSV